MHAIRTYLAAALLALGMIGARADIGLGSTDIRSIALGATEFRYAFLGTQQIFVRYKDLYVSDYSLTLFRGRLWRIDPLSPSLEAGRFGNIGLLSAGNFPTGLAPAPDGDLYLLRSQRVDRVDPEDPDSTTGVYGRVGFFGLNIDTNGLAVESSGTLLTLRDHTPDELYRLDLSVGTVTVLGDLPAGVANARGLAVKPNGDVYVVNSSPTQLWLINPDDPDSETDPYGLIGTLAFAPWKVKIAVDSNLIVTTFSGNVYLVDPDNPGSTTPPYGLLGSMPDDVQNPQGVRSPPPPPTEDPK